MFPLKRPSGRVFQQVPRVGEYGLGTAGVWGDTGGANYVGLMGTADSGLAGVFQNNSTQYPSLLVTNYAGGGGTIFTAYGYTAFDVHELRGGSSNIAFDYRIMAKRNGFANVRLADVTKKYQQMEQQQRALRERMAQPRAK